jgi:hypothetical protein
MAARPAPQPVRWADCSATKNPKPWLATSEES